LGKLKELEKGLKVPSKVRSRSKSDSKKEGEKEMSILKDLGVPVFKAGGMPTDAEMTKKRRPTKRMG
jgi:hypothetical protein